MDDVLEELLEKRASLDVGVTTKIVDLSGADGETVLSMMAEDDKTDCDCFFDEATATSLGLDGWSGLADVEEVHTGLCSVVHGVTRSSFWQVWLAPSL